jgi:preprotein translocase subunit SecF
MSWRFRLVRDDTNFDFVGKRFFAFVISFIVVFGSLALITTKGINVGVDFTGGTLIEVNLPTQPDLAKLRHDLNALELGAISLQEFGGPQNVLLRLPQQKGDADSQAAAVTQVKTVLSREFSSGVIDYRRVEYVGPQVGDELKRAGILAFVLSIVGILAYVALRFEWQFGLVAVMAVTRDAVVTLGLFAVTGWEFDLSTMGAVLLVAGYSINDTVVVFDRIRENLRKYRKMPMAELLNLSTNQVLPRSLMTSFTTLLALSALAIFGGEVIASFTYALIVGVVAGTFSSVFMSSPALLYLNLRGDNKPEAAAGA